MAVAKKFMTSGTIVFLVNGGQGSAMAERARSFQERLKPEFPINIAYRSPNKIAAIFQFLWLLARQRPALCYVFDIGFSGIVAAGLYRALSSVRLVVDTGDSIYELSRITGNRTGLGLWLTKWLETGALWISDRVVVRSHPHQELLALRGIAAEVIPDGVDLNQFRPNTEESLRRELGLEGYTVIGLLGSVVWSRRLEMCYGWEIIEVIDRLREALVKGVVIGDGSGLAELKARCAARGLEDRILFLGRVPYDELPRYINLMDLCISTQTNDAAGQVRTTGKLPLYLSCGKFVLATDVGEAARVLPADMLIRYQGSRDLEYPARLASRIESLLKTRETLTGRADSIAIARANFDYGLLSSRVAKLFRELLAIAPSRGAAPSIG